MPVLVITGADDKIIPAEQSIQLAAELPNASLVVIPICGHVPQEECPAEFMNAVDAFINNLP
jgi:pimeloyl-ACP methyl ester carboxylesterase